MISWNFLSSPHHGLKFLKYGTTEWWFSYFTSPLTTTTRVISLRELSFSKLRIFPLRGNFSGAHNFCLLLLWIFGNFHPSSCKHNDYTFNANSHRYCTICVKGYFSFNLVAREMPNLRYSQMLFFCCLSTEDLERRNYPPDCFLSPHTFLLKYFFSRGGLTVRQNKFLLVNYLTTWDFECISLHLINRPFFLAQLRIHFLEFYSPCSNKQAMHQLAANSSRCF